IYRLNRLFFVAVISAGTSLLFGITTLFYVYTYNYSPDIFASLLFLWGFLCVLTGKHYGGVFLLGLSVFAKVSNSVMVGIAVLSLQLVLLRPTMSPDKPRWSVNTTNLKKVFLVVLVFGLSLAPFLASNYLLFGSPFVT